jgi:hypothetical protein
VKHIPAATNYRGNGFGTKHIYVNDFLKDRKTVLKPLEAVIPIRFSRSYEKRSDQTRRDYRLFKIHLVTKQADVETFVLCLIVTVTLTVS